MKKLIVLILYLLYGLSAYASNFYAARINDPDGYTSLREGPGVEYPLVGELNSEDIFFVSCENKWCSIISFDKPQLNESYIYEGRIEKLKEVPDRVREKFVNKMIGSFYIFRELTHYTGNQVILYDENIQAKFIDYMIALDDTKAEFLKYYNTIKNNPAEVERFTATLEGCYQCHSQNFIAEILPATEINEDKLREKVDTAFSLYTSYLPVHIKDSDGYTNLRKGPGIDFPIAGSVEQNDILYANCEGMWCKVLSYEKPQFNDNYIYKKNITALNEMPNKVKKKIIEDIITSFNATREIGWHSSPYIDYYDYTHAGLSYLNIAREIALGLLIDYYCDTMDNETLAVLLNSRDFRYDSDYSSLAQLYLCHPKDFTQTLNSIRSYLKLDYKKRIQYGIEWLLTYSEGYSDIAELSPAAYIARINDPDGYANLREGPGTEYPVLGTLSQNDIFYADCKDRWCRVYLYNNKMYMYGSKLDLYGSYVHEGHIENLEEATDSVKKNVIEGIFKTFDLLKQQYADSSYETRIGETVYEYEKSKVEMALKLLSE